MELRERIAAALYSSEWKESAPAKLEGADTYWHQQADRILAIPEIAEALSIYRADRPCTESGKTIWFSRQRPFDDPWQFDELTGTFKRISSAPHTKALDSATISSRVNSIVGPAPA